VKSLRDEYIEAARLAAERSQPLTDAIPASLPDIFPVGFSERPEKTEIKEGMETEQPGSQRGRGLRLLGFHDETRRGRA